MPSVKDFASKNFASKKFIKKDIRAWNVLDMVNNNKNNKDNNKEDERDIDNANTILQKDISNVEITEQEQENRLENAKENKQEYIPKYGADRIFFGSGAVCDSIYNNELLNNRDSDLANNKITNYKNIRETNRETNDGDETKIIEVSYKALQGDQQKILKKIISFCNETGQTGVLSRDDFAEFEIRAFKTNVARLIKKGLITRGNFKKKGRGGYFSFELTQALKNLLMT